MEQGKGYTITNLTKYQSKYGERLLAELDGESKLFLPERYNLFNDKQIAELGNGTYTLINKGKRGNIFLLELIKSSDYIKNQKQQESTKVENLYKINEQMNTQSFNVDHLERQEEEEQGEEDDEQESQGFSANFGYYTQIL